MIAFDSNDSQVPPKKGVLVFARLDLQNAFQRQPRRAGEELQLRQAITKWKSEPKLRKTSISGLYHSLQQASWVCAEMKFDAGGFVVDADVEGVRRDGRGGAGKEAWGQWVGGEIERGTCCRFVSNCSSRGHTDQNHLRTGFLHPSKTCWMKLDL